MFVDVFSAEYTYKTKAVNEFVHFNDYFYAKRFMWLWQCGFMKIRKHIATNLCL